MEKSHSGKFILRLNPAVHRSLKIQAQTLGISLNELCASKLSSSLKEKDNQALANDKLLSQLFLEFGEDLNGIILFGSVANGSARANSDVDYLVVLSESIKITRSLYGNFDYDLKDSAGRLISLHFVHLPSSPSEAGSIWLECSLSGIIIFDPLSKIHRTLSEIRLHISSGTVVRKETHGQGYWVRK